jgi:maleate isomerase
MDRPRRLGLIVPSSNVTMETEIPEMLRRRGEVAPETFTFHASRMRMRRVTKDELIEMDEDSDRCTVELSDTRPDAFAYACLIAIMAQDPGYHLASEERLAQVAAAHGAMAPVVSSAGALVRATQALGATRVVLVAPYLKPLTQLVIDYLRASGIGVTDAISLEVPDNLEVAKIDPLSLIARAEGLDRTGTDALILSACVQMPSLPAIAAAEERFGLPVLSAATATVFDLLGRLGLATIVPRAGRLLSGTVAAAPRR